MSPEHVEWVWLDASVCVTLSELSDCCGLSLAELQELVDYSALVPVAPALPPFAVAQLPAAQLFSAGWVPPLRAASKLRHDYDLEIFSVAVLLGMLNRIEALEREVRTLQTQVSADTVLKNA